MKALHSAIALGAALAVLPACNDQATEPSPPEMVAGTVLPTEGVPGWQLADTPQVVLLDDQGRPVPGVEVTWTVRQGGGSVVPVNSITDAVGVSAAVWTLGPDIGTNELRATTILGDPVDFQVNGSLFQAQKVAASHKGLACGLVQSAVWCWGSDFWGNGTAPSVPAEGGLSFSPGLLDASRKYVDVAVAWWKVCALDDQGRVWCASTQDHQLTERTGLPALWRIIGDGGQTGQFCGLAASDSMPWCWTHPLAPYPISPSPALRDLWMAPADGGSPFAPWDVINYRACGLLADSSAGCWGRGQVGDSTTGWGDGYAVRSTRGGHKFVDMVVGNRWSCGRTAIGEAWCWGEGTRGGTTRIVPVLVATGVQRFGAISDRVTSLQVGGDIDQWFGEDRPDELEPPTGLTGVGVADFAQGMSGCAITVNDLVYCLAEVVAAPRMSGQYREYHPIQPVRRVPLTSKSRRLLAGAVR